MKIQKEELVLVPIRETAHCEKCGSELGEAVLLPQGFVINDKGQWVRMNDHLYSYTCPQCGTVEESDEEFPRTIYEHRAKDGKIVDEQG